MHRFPRLMKNLPSHAMARELSVVQAHKSMEYYDPNTGFRLNSPGTAHFLQFQLKTVFIVRIKPVLFPRNL